MAARARTHEVTEAELLRLAGELETLMLSFPQTPSRTVEAAVARLNAACQRVTAAVSPCALLRLPEEILLRMLRALSARDLAALASSCHAVSDGALSTLIDRGAHDAIGFQYSAAFAVLPPKALRAHARLRWIERARIEAKRWLESVHHRHGIEVSQTVWPKAESVSEPPSASWIEAVARFAGEGYDCSLDEPGSFSSHEQGAYADDGVKAALQCFVPMATRAGLLMRHPGRNNYYDTQVGDFQPPAISTGAVQWVADKVSAGMHISSELLAHHIKMKLLHPFKPDWKTRDRGDSTYSEGTNAVTRAFNLRQRYEPFLRAMLAATLKRQGDGSSSATEMRLVVGEMLAAASCVSVTSGNAREAVVLRWGEVPPSEADTLLEEAVASVRRSGTPLTDPLAKRAMTSYAGCLSQQGRFADAANILREVLEAFIRRDGGYSPESWGHDYGLAMQIQTLARHTHKAGPEACMAGAMLLRVHVNALRQGFTSEAGNNMRNLYFEDDARLLLSHCMKAEGGALLDEAEALARELAKDRRHERDLAILAQLHEVLEAQVARGKEGAAAAAEASRTDISTTLLEVMNMLPPSGAESDRTLGQFFENMLLSAARRRNGYRKIISASNELCGISVRFLRQHGILDTVEAMQKLKVGECLANATGTDAGARLSALRAQGRLSALLLIQGKYDEANTRLSEASAFVDDVTGHRLRDFSLTLSLLGRCPRVAIDEDADAGEEDGEGEDDDDVDDRPPIISVACKVSILQNTIAACQRQFTEDHPEAATIQRVLVDTAQDLTSVLLSEGRNDEAESVARLGIDTANQALIRARFIAELVVGPDGETFEQRLDDVDRATCNLERSLKSLRALFERIDPERAQEHEAILLELLDVYQRRLSHSEQLRGSRGWYDEMSTKALRDQRFEMEFFLAELYYDRLKRRSDAQRLLQELIGKTSETPQVRARALQHLGIVHVQEATEADEKWEGDAAKGYLSQAEPLLSRASAIMLGLLENGTQCSCHRPLEWTELSDCFELHETVLASLGRTSDAEHVYHKRCEIFCDSSDASGAEEGDNEEGEAEQAERMEGVEG